MHDESSPTGERVEDSPHPGRLKVMFSFKEDPEVSNPFTTLLADSVSTHVEVEYFSWWRALVRSIDVLHIHWPELLVRSSSPTKTILKAALRRIVFLKLKVTRAAIVSTRHNLQPHDAPTGAERRALASLDRATNAWILLNRHTPAPTTVPTAVIPHGHYRDWYDTTPLPRTGGLLYFGLVRPYKGVEALVEAYDQLGETVQLPLDIVGFASDKALRSELETAAARNAKITFTPAFVDDETLGVTVRRARLVVLPYRNMHNSGAALLALSLGTPILVPDNEVTRDLQAEFGSQWVHLFQEEVKASDLADAMRELDSEFPEGTPDMSAREWDRIGALHLDAYRRARGALREGSR